MKRLSSREHEPSYSELLDITEKLARRHAQTRKDLDDALKIYRMSSLPASIEHYELIVTLMVDQIDKTLARLNRPVID